MTESHDDEIEPFEAYLREFRPREPLALAAPAAPRRRGVWIAAVAASIVAAVIVNEMRRPPKAPSAGEGQPAAVPGASVQPARDAARTATLFEASRMAADPVVLDRWLIEVSRTVLPDPERPNSSLRVLARE